MYDWYVDVLHVCVTYTGFDLIGYDWLYSWFHGGCVVTAVEVYSSPGAYYRNCFFPLEFPRWPDGDTINDFIFTPFSDSFYLAMAETFGSHQ